MVSRKKLIISGASVGLGALMLVLGYSMMSNYTQDVNNQDAGIGFAYMLIGFFLLMFAAGYALSKPAEEAPGTPARSYRINDPERVGLVSREIRQDATLGSSIGSSLGSHEIIASDFTPAERTKDR